MVTSGDSIRLEPVSGSARPGDDSAGREMPPAGQRSDTLTRGNALTGQESDPSTRGDTPARPGGEPANWSCSAGKGGRSRESAPDGEQALAANRPVSDLRIVAVNEDYVALHKPREMHSAHIAGGRAASLERLLADEWERLRQEFGQMPQTSHEVPPAAVPQSSRMIPSVDAPPSSGVFPSAAVPSSSSLLSPPPILLTRLDEATSGIVLAALTPEAAERFRSFERGGLTQKSYFAVVRGRLSHPLAIKNRLAVDNRKMTRVLDEDDPDPTRHTVVIPLAVADAVLEEESCDKQGEGDRAGCEATLIRVRITRGARHQIRAHLAGAGFPLVGEWMYPTAAERTSGARLYLHHARVEFPGFSALDMPGWNIGECLEESRDTEPAE